MTKTTMSGYGKSGTYNATAPTLNDGDETDFQFDTNGNLKTASGDTNGLKVEQRYSYSRKTASGQVTASAGFLHTVTFSATTGTVTAGPITIYDNPAATGTVVWAGYIQASLNPTTIILDVSCSSGIWVDYGSPIANVAVTVSYR